MKTPEIRREYPVADIREIIIDWNGFSYLVIYGRHINGWFIAIPNWEVCVEASEPTDVLYNTEKLAKFLNNANAGRELAEAIKEHWESNN
ncbi:MAG: hypothetical protein LUI12_01675 [Clostridiales bacterium]|nr:hypothetical protein [Clostridiales bacterium]